MSNLRHWLAKNYKTPSKALVGTLAVLSFTAFLVSVFLSAKHYAGEIPPCSIVEGCEVVTTSEFSEVFGVPVAAFGVPYFLALIVLLVGYMQNTARDKFIKLAFVLSIPGALAALMLLSIQAFVLGAFCLYCLAVDISSIVIFLSLWRLFWHKNG